MYQSFYSNPSPGFPSPADDYADNSLDLNAYLVSNPVATYFVRMKGNSMCSVGIYADDLLIIDRSLKPESGSIVLAYLNNDFVIKKMSDLSSHDIFDSDDLKVWGVVRFIVHRTHV